MLGILFGICALFGQVEVSMVRPLEGPYLGQKPPGMEPILFAPGVVSTDAPELNAIFSPDGREFFFARNLAGVIVMFHSIQQKGRWSEPEKIKLIPDQQDKDEVDMMFSPDGRKLYFISNAVLPKDEEPNVSIWVSEKRNQRWLAAKPLPEPIYSLKREFFPSFSLDGSMYFASERQGGFGNFDVYRSQYQGGVFQSPVNLGSAINSAVKEGDSFVDPEEQYLIVTTRRPGGQGKADLFISFRKLDGGWHELVNLGAPINSDQNDFCPFVTSDKRYLFFTRAADIYWVDAAVLFRKKP